MLLDSEDARRFLKCSQPTLYRMLRRGEIQAFKMGNRWKFREESLKRWTRDREREHSNRVSRSGD